ncbi:MAG: hypothetical protein IPM57_02450 [Oligoflexia bacterium]|nr:hypothetical protein [Oligoflexia bacterium]
MKRILTIIEDLNEQNFLEVLLKKISFDVLSLRKEAQINSNALGFRPNLVIATGDGAKINGHRVAKEIKVKGVNPKLILLFPINQAIDKKITSSYKCHGVLETPINPLALIEAICSVLDLEKEPILKKYERLPVTQQQQQVSNSEPSIRSKKYAEILKKVPPSKENGFSRKIVSEEVKKMREYEDNNKEVEEIDEMRKKYVSALFKK